MLVKLLTLYRLINLVKGIFKDVVAVQFVQPLAKHIQRVLRRIGKYNKQQPGESRKAVNFEIVRLRIVLFGR